MPNVQQWGRRESLIWPPHRYLYTLGALFLALLATGLFVWLRFQYGLQPLEQYYFPYLLCSETTGTLRPSSNYQLLFVADGKSHTRPALNGDVQPGQTVQGRDRPLPQRLPFHATTTGLPRS
jgi:hypothetical protein